MTTAPKQSSKLVALKAADKNINAQAQAALEQMYGYFTFAPMPTERADERLAA